MKVIPHIRTNFGTLGTSFTKFGSFLVHFWYILELLKPLSYYPWSVYSFRDLWEVIGDCSLLRNGLWNTYLHFHSPFLPLETLRKLLKVVPHLIMDFGNIGTSFTKFGHHLQNFVNDVPRVPKCIPRWGSTLNYFLMGC